MTSVKVTLINTILAAVLSLIVSLTVARFTNKNQNKIYRPLLQLRYRIKEKKFTIDDVDNSGVCQDITTYIPFIDINNMSNYGAFNIKINVRLKNKYLSYKKRNYIQKYYIDVLNPNKTIQLNDNIVNLPEYLAKAYQHMLKFSKKQEYKDYVKQLFKERHMLGSSYIKLIGYINSDAYNPDKIKHKILISINKYILDYWDNYVLKNIDIWLTTMQGEQVKITYENYQGILMIKKKGYKRCKYNYSDLKNTKIIYQ